MKTDAHSKIRALLVSGNHLIALGNALTDYRHYVNGRLEAGKSLSKFANSKAQDEYFASWGRSREATDDLITQVTALSEQLEREEREEIASSPVSEDHFERFNRA